MWILYNQSGVGIQEPKMTEFHAGKEAMLIWITLDMFNFQVTLHWLTTQAAPLFKEASFSESPLLFFYITNTKAKHWSLSSIFKKSKIRDYWFKLCNFCPWRHILLPNQHTTRLIFLEDVWKKPYYIRALWARHMGTRRMWSRDRSCLYARQSSIDGLTGGPPRHEGELQLRGVPESEQSYPVSGYAESLEPNNGRGRKRP